MTNPPHMVEGESREIRQDFDRAIGHKHREPAPERISDSTLDSKRGASNARIATPPNYRTICADPPWPYETSKTGRFAMPKPAEDIGQRGVESMGYSVMEIHELKAIQPPAEDDAHLYLWTTNAFMREAIEIAEAWGFKQKTILTWTKVHQDDRSRVSMKTGYYFRGATEHCLFCVRGSLKLQTEEALPTAYLWPREPHSVKPDAFYDLVEKASPGPYLEMFARRARLGDWSYFGNESLGTAQMPERSA